MDSQIYKKRLQGSKPFDWRVFYIIGKVLESKCLKWARMTHLGSSNINYGQKKCRESNWQFDYEPLKVGNCPNFLMSRCRSTYRWKALDDGYNFVSEFTSIGGFHTTLWASKVAKVLILGILWLPFWKPYDKMTFEC